MNTAAIIVAGGIGERFGSYPKQFQILGRKMVIDYSIEVALRVVDQVVVVLPYEFMERYTTELTNMGVHNLALGGNTRSESVRNGLKLVEPTVQKVLVHDAARPLASKILFEKVLSKLNEGEKAVVPTIEVTDTVKRISKKYVDRTLDRSVLGLAQTPQGFDKNLLQMAHESFGNATDDSTLVELLGYTVAVVPGEVENIKITKPFDLIVAQMILDRQN